MKHLAWLAAFALISCNNNTEKNKATTDTIAETNMAPAPHTTEAAAESSLQGGCYYAANGRDTIWLQLHINGSEVTGQMQYDNFEIDGNMGTIQGVVEANRVKGYFTFLSEGQWSVRQVVFEERNGQLLQGSTNNMQYEKDTALFATPNPPLDAQRPFAPIPCSQVRFPKLPAQNVSKPF